MCVRSHQSKVVDESPAYHRDEALAEGVTVECSILSLVIALVHKGKRDDSIDVQYHAP